MNRDRRLAREARPFRLRAPVVAAPEPRTAPVPDRDDIARWVAVEVHGWPRTVADRQVAVRMGVPLQHVRVIRADRLRTAA